MKLLVDFAVRGGASNFSKGCVTVDRSSKLKKICAIFISNLEGNNREIAAKDLFRDSSEFIRCIIRCIPHAK